MNEGSVTQPSRAAIWPQAPGEMAELIRAHDWTSTPLGPIESWPQPLKTMVGTILSVPQAMWIGWGPEFIQIYNDAYRRLLDTERHRTALGQPASQTWADTWSLAGPQLESVIATMRATRCGALSGQIREGEELRAFFRLAVGQVSAQLDAAPTQAIASRAHTMQGCGSHRTTTNALVSLKA